MSKIFMPIAVVALIALNGPANAAATWNGMAVNGCMRQGLSINGMHGTLGAEGREKTAASPVVGSVTLPGGKELMLH